MPRERCRLPLHPEFYMALGRIHQVTPVESWPAPILQLMKNGLTIERSDRTKLVCFLWGNGSNADDVLILLKHKLRDQSAEQHVRSLLADCRCPEKARRLFYYDVNQGDCLDMAGFPHGEADGYRLYRRMLNSWDSYSWHHPDVTLAMQKKFLSQRACPDASTFFKLFA